MDAFEQGGAIVALLKCGDGSAAVKPPATGVVSPSKEKESALHTRNHLVCTCISFFLIYLYKEINNNIYVLVFYFLCFPRIFTLTYLCCFLQKNRLALSDSSISPPPSSVSLAVQPKVCGAPPFFLSPFVLLFMYSNNYIRNRLDTHIDITVAPISKGLCISLSPLLFSSYINDRGEEV